MFSFVVENKGKADLSVTGTYMNVVRQACEFAGKEAEYIQMGQAAREKDSYIVTDTIQAAFLYFCKGYKNHIIWMQGVVPEESFMRRKSKLRFFLISIMEKFVLKRAKLVLLVSEAMRTHYEKKYKFDLSQKSVIMPCFNETEITKSAFEDGKYQKNEFVYVGSLHAWQCFEQTVQLYAEIEKRANTPTRFHVYTFQKDEAREILSQYGVKNYEVDCVDKEELSARIKRIKYGFVLREDCAVNRVATPTKFSNYLANGIIPIYSSALESFAAFDKSNRLGIVYDFGREQDGLQNILSHMDCEVSAEAVREKCEHAFATYYNAENYCNVIAEKIKQLIR